MENLRCGHGAMGAAVCRANLGLAVAGILRIATAVDHRIRAGFRTLFQRNAGIVVTHPGE
jgi:hypothetical protein